MKASHQVPTLAKPQRLPRQLLVLALGLGAGPALAQQPIVPRALPAPTDTVRRVVDLPAAELDSLAAAPLVPAVDSARLLWLQTPATLYELVNDRMACLQSDMPLHFNEAVLAYVRLFTERQRGYTQRVLEREQFYFPTFEKYLAQYHLPIDLKYLSVVESALIPTAKSPVGAVGLWQFMPPTAGDLRLKRDEWVDERMHPEKATEAACKHLRYLYGIFHDWELVLAAYNWGAGNVHRVMRRTGKKTFWELYPHLPAETRNYVPTFTGVLYAMKYAADYRLNDAALRYQRFEALDTLGLRGQAFDLRRLSRALGYADSSAIGRYNPEVRQGALPAGYRPYVLRFPSAAREQLTGVDRATLLAYCQPATELPRPLLARTVYLTGQEPAPVLAAAAGRTAPRYQRVHYTVRRGQTLATVAERFDVSAAQLRHWNNLPKAAPLRPGRDLVVLRPLPAAAAAPVLAIAATAPASPASLPRLAAPADSVALALTAANARFAREAQAHAQREATLAQELVLRQRQQATRAIAQQRALAAKAAALAKAARQEKDNQDKASLLAATEPASEAPEVAASPDQSPQPADSLVAQPRASRLVRLATPRPPAEDKAVATARSSESPAGPTFYVVRPGDNLTKVAQANNLSVAQLRDWNQLPATGGVQAGQRLRLSAPLAAAADRVAVRAARPALVLRTTTHIVQPRDTLYSISRQFRVSVEELKRLNHLKSDAVISGQKLVVPAG